MSTKLVTVVGINGSQGGSVANHFLSEAGWKIRGITRSASGEKAKAWTDKGVEIVEADLNDQASVERAFKGSHAIFLVTDYAGNLHSVMADEAQLKKAESLGITGEAYSGKLEVSQGVNAANAAATSGVLATLERFVFSSLPGVLEMSKGKYKHAHEFDAKHDIEQHIRKNLPELEKRLSTVTMGNYLENWPYITALAPQKEKDGSYSLLWMDCEGEHQAHPELWASRDAGLFVKSLILDQPIGTQALASTAIIGAADYAAMWSRVMGYPAQKKLVSVEEYAALVPEPIRKAFVELIQFVTEYGVDHLKNAEQLGITPTPLEEFIKSQEWVL